MSEKSIARQEHDHSALPQGRDIFFLSLGVIGIGSSGPLIAKSTMAIPALIFWRNLGGSLLIAPFALRHAQWRDGQARKSMIFAAIAGIALSFHFIFFFAAMRFTSVATGTALAALQPIFTAIYFRLRGDHIRKQAFVGMLVAFASVVVITGIDLSLSHRYFLGDIFAILSAMLAALYVLMGSKAQRHLLTSTYTSICYLSCAVVAFPLIFITHSALMHYQAREWLWVVLLILGAQLLGHTMFNLSLKRLSPIVVSLVVFFEVPAAAIFAFFWLHQRPSHGIIPGIIGLLIGCTIFATAGKSKSS